MPHVARPVIRGVALGWFVSYLTERKQYVSYKCTDSKLFSIICGVPQGSVLGPLLFILYSNDLPGSIQCTTCILFADDTTIYVSGRNITELYKLVNQDITSLVEWFTVNKVSLNKCKTHHVLFSKTKNVKSDTHVLKLDNTIINRVKCVKFLGLLIDENLNWHERIDSCRSQISGGLYALKKIKHILSTHNIRTQYCSLIYPYLTYSTLAIVCLQSFNVLTEIINFTEKFITNKQDLLLCVRVSETTILGARA